MEALAADIEQTVAKRELAEGERITTVAALRAETKLGKQTISEALRLLADRGVIDIRPGRNGGAFVARKNPVVRLRQTLLEVPDGATDVADAIAVREALEELICTDAARMHTARDTARLRAIVERMRRCSDAEQFMAQNWVLHEKIASITTNHVARAVYLGTLRCIRDLSTTTSSAASDPATYLQKRWSIHADLVEAIATGDEKLTAKAVRAHRGSRSGVN
ncbi:FadR/GntR family transcriptional regulator [Williamsia sp. M5A3_1d]